MWMKLTLSSPEQKCNKIEKFTIQEWHRVAIYGSIWEGGEFSTVLGVVTLVFLFPEEASSSWGWPSTWSLQFIIVDVGHAAALGHLIIQPNKHLSVKSCTKLYICIHIQNYLVSGISHQNQEMCQPYFIVSSIMLCSTQLPPLLHT